MPLSQEPSRWQGQLGVISLQCWHGGLKGTYEGCFSIGLDAARSLPFAAECLEAATSPTEDQNGSRVRVTSMVEDLGWYLEIAVTDTGLVEILSYPGKPGFVSQTMCGLGWVVCCLLKGDAQF